MCSGQERSARPIGQPDGVCFWTESGGLWPRTFCAGTSEDSRGESLGLASAILMGRLPDEYDVRLVWLVGETP